MNKLVTVELLQAPRFTKYAKYTFREMRMVKVTARTLVVIVMLASRMSITYVPGNAIQYIHDVATLWRHSL